VGAIKRTSADMWFSKCVRERTNWTCERCSRQFHPGATGGLDCSHFIGRAHHSIRHHPQNAFAHCMGCHKHMGSCPPDIMDAYLDTFGQDAYDNIQRLRNDIVIGKAVRKDQKANRSKIAAHYRREHEKMEEQRHAGVMGRIEFNWFNPVDI
jgi:hypothetical protein